MKVIGSDFKASSIATYPKSQLTCGLENEKAGKIILRLTRLMSLPVLSEVIWLGMHQEINPDKLSQGAKA